MKKFFNTQAPGTILVDREQTGNPVLSCITKCPWSFVDKHPYDYSLGARAGAYFLSIRYHRMHPNYIYERVRRVSNASTSTKTTVLTTPPKEETGLLRLLILLVDVPNPEKTILELTRVSLSLEFSIVLAWSNEEAARYLETFKLFEHRSADSIRARKPPPSLSANTNNCSLKKDVSLSAAIDFLTALPKVNRTDAATMLASFGTPGHALDVKRQDLELCAGFGETKIGAVLGILNEPFVGGNAGKSGGEDDEGDYYDMHFGEE